MTWLTPTIAGIAAAIAVPALIILYFLKLRRRDVEISTTLLWKKTIQDIQANAPFQRLRKNILLFLQLLVLAGILLAIAQPQIRGDISTGTQRVILIDRSASMSALDGNPDAIGEARGAMTRLDKAKEAALKLVDSLREPSVLGTGAVDEAMVIAFDTTAEVRQQFTADKARLRAAIESIEPSDAPSALTEALRLARAHLPDKVLADTVTDESGTTTTRNITLEGVKAGGATIHLYSDGRLPDAERAITSAEDTVTFVQIGTTNAPNIGITAMRADRAFDSPIDISLYVGLENTSRSPQNVDLELLIDGVTTRVTTITVPAAAPPVEAALGDDASENAVALAAMLPWTPGVTGRTFEFQQTEGGVFAVQITPANPESDLLSIDNRAWMIIPPARQLSVALVSRGNLFLTTALEGLPLARLVQYTPDQYAGAVARGDMAEFDVVIFDGWVPTIDGTPGLPPGRFLVFGAIPSPLGVAAGSEPKSAMALDWRRDHPVMRLLLLDRLQILKLPDVIVPDESGATVLAETDRGPAILELAQAQTRALIVPFDIGESTWPLDVSFVVFVGAGVNYVGQEGGVFGASGDAFRPGSVLVDRLPIGAKKVRLELPGTPDRAELQPATDGRIAYGPIRKAGLYAASWIGPAGAGDATDGSRVVRMYAANLVDPVESDIAATPLLRLTGNEIEAENAENLKTMVRLWPWIILAALTVLMLEWYIYNRKVYL